MDHMAKVCLDHLGPQQKYLYENILSTFYVESTVIDN